jgi:hypothetical protein
MKTLSIAAVLAVLGLTAVPAFAAENEIGTVHGRPMNALERSLLDRGMVAAGFEEWGALIRAWVPNDKGGTSMVLLDPDTLDPVTPGRS